MTELKTVRYNCPVLAEADHRAHKSWVTNGTVDQEYVFRVLGDPAGTFVPQVPPVRVLSPEDLREMDCPFPPEPGYAE
jgi:hypothetical protein